MRRSRQRSKALLALKRLFLASNQVWQAPIHPSYSVFQNWSPNPFGFCFSFNFIWHTKFFDFTFQSMALSSLLTQLTALIFRTWGCRLLCRFQSCSTSFRAKISQFLHKSTTLILPWLIDLSRGIRQKISLCCFGNVLLQQSKVYQSNNKRASDNDKKFAKKWIWSV